MHAWDALFMCGLSSSGHEFKAAKSSEILRFSYTIKNACFLAVFVNGGSFGVKPDCANFASK